MLRGVLLLILLTCLVGGWERVLAGFLVVGLGAHLVLKAFRGPSDRPGCRTGRIGH